MIEKDLFEGNFKLTTRNFGIYAQMNEKDTSYSALL